MLKYLLLLMLLSISDGEKGFCSLNDLGCLSGLARSVDYESYIYKELTNIQDFLYKDELDKIDRLKYENPREALTKVNVILAEFPNSPRGLNSKARIYYQLYKNLDEESKVIGRVEHLKGAVEAVIKLLKVQENPPKPLVRSAASFGVGICEEEGERVWSIHILNQILNGPNQDAFSVGERKEYYTLFLEQLYLNGDFTKVVQVVDESTDKYPSQTLQHKILKTLSLLYLEKEMDPLYYRSNADIQIHISTETIRQEVTEYLRELETLLRKEKRKDDLNMVIDLCIELGLCTSRYQRDQVHMDDLRGHEVWDVNNIEQKGHKEVVASLEDKWKQIREEVLKLVDSTPEEKFFMKSTESDDPEHKYKQLLLREPGHTFASEYCSALPVLCSVLQDVPAVDNCTFGFVSIGVFEAGARLDLQLEDTNTKLNIILPLLISEGETGMALSEKIGVVLAEGETLIFDPSFEHKKWNTGKDRAVLLSVDIDHPDLTPLMKEQLEAVRTGDIEVILLKSFDIRNRFKKILGKDGVVEKRLGDGDNVEITQSAQ